ncbi:DNA-binding transcriptional response regulator/ Signal receiver domain protein [Halomicronema hongdechloris C2206]|uniref:DNA-binding transcriptional response regulator/ Signal receiver domain protein n=2 Tax=Halomicronema hongdechloris TaxID=1209493 RepID=A0A1Z3HNT9_9CYAN|nr:DNA-binding transcriptional response regulator/ Signal receiver domain protein [Halomicronema hongdechloris C2206]
MGLRCTVVATPSQALALLRTQLPAGVLLWIDQATLDIGMTLLDALTDHGEHIPSLLVTDTQDFQQRLQMVQRGADRLLLPSISPQHALEIIQESLHTTGAAHKVLILDDDSQVLELLQAVLSPWGFQLTTLADPTQLLPTLEAVRPRLLVLDVEMPQINRLEICRVLRADDRWRQLPILILTVHEDIPTQQQAFQVGVDDFISKPVMAADLANRILNRLQRVQAQESS